MKVRIVSDGTPYGTKVMDAETGDVIEKVRSITWECGVDGVATATINTILTKLDVLAEVQVVTICPQCKQPNMERRPSMETRKIDVTTAQDEKPVFILDHSQLAQ